MEERAIEVKNKNNKKVIIRSIPGHFATNHSHINYYVDMTKIKTHHTMAKETAKELAEPYVSSTNIDTIICLEGTEVIGAYLAEALTQSGHRSINEGKDIAVITPEMNSNNQMIFRDNLQKSIFGKHILLLIPSISTGKTIKKCSQGLRYYNGTLISVASIFSAISEYDGIEINYLFSDKDISGYKTMSVDECELCKSGQKVDAIVNSFGYSKI